MNGETTSQAQKALQFLLDVARLAPVNAATHEQCAGAAQFLLQKLESVAIKHEEEVDGNK